MKFITTIAVLATAVLAAPNPEPWCYRIGMPCDKVKRVAEAFVNSVQTSEGLAARSDSTSKFDGIPNDIAINALDGLDTLASLVVYSSKDPDLLNGLKPAGNKDKKPSKRNVEAQQDKRWCFRIGMPCDKAKRNQVVEKRDVELQEDKRWCFRIGMPCDKAKRNQVEEKRDVELQQDKRWCFRIGMPCDKAKRAAEAVINAIREDGFDVEKRDFDAPEEKRSCFLEGGACWEAFTNLKKLHHSARAILNGLE